LIDSPTTSPYTPGARGTGHAMIGGAGGARGTGALVAPPLVLVILVALTSSKLLVVLVGPARATKINCMSKSNT
jgi:hypothetical protein